MTGPFFYGGMKDPLATDPEKPWIGFAVTGEGRLVGTTPDHHATRGLAADAARRLYPGN